MMKKINFLLIFFIVLLSILIPVISLGVTSEVDKSSALNLKLKNNYFKESGRSEILAQFNEGYIKKDEISSLDIDSAKVLISLLKVHPTEEVEESEKKTLLSIYDLLAKNSNVVLNGIQIVTDIKTYSNYLQASSTGDISSEDNTDYIKETIKIITKENSEIYNKVNTCSIVELAEIINTTIVSTPWESIPQKNRIQYFQFLERLSTNSELNKAVNENYLTYLSTRISAIEKTDLSKEEKSALEKVKENIKNRKKAVDSNNTDIVQGNIKDGADYIFYKPDTLDVNGEDTTSLDGLFEDAENFLSSASQQNVLDKKVLINFSSQLYNTLLTMGITISVIIGGIIGLTLITSSSSAEKAKVMSFLVPYIVGCIIVFGAFGIWKIIVSSIQNSTESVQTGTNSNGSNSSGSSGNSSGNSNSSHNIDPSSKIKLDRSLIILDPERYNTAQIKATVTPKQEKITWVSSNSSVASVDSVGRVTANYVGNATITASLKLSNNKTISAKCKIIVVETNEIPSDAYLITDISSKTTNVSSFIESLDKMARVVENDYKNPNISNWKYYNSNCSLTFKNAEQKHNKRTNCALYVNWALKEIGAMKKTQSFFAQQGKITWRKGAKETLSKTCSLLTVGKTPNQLLKEGNLKIGDICLWEGHTNVYAGNKKWYDAGGAFIAGTPGDGGTFSTLGPKQVSRHMSNTVLYILRLKDAS